MSGKKSVLGRGLGALIEDASLQRNEFKGIFQIALTDIRCNPFQPRNTFDEESLNELAESIAMLGIIQPVTVRQVEDQKYELISGERRLRASKIAGLDVIPAFVRETDDQGMLEMSLVENIQREDLDAIEVAVSYNRLIEECRLTQEKLSERVGKQRSTVANYLRLLKLPPEIQLGIRQRKISMGHARALINIEDPETQIMIFHQILHYDFSVRKVEDVVRELTKNEEKSSTKRVQISSDVKRVCDKLKHKLKCKVDVKKSSDGKGKIILSFQSEKEFNNLVNHLIE